MDNFHFPEFSMSIRPHEIETIEHNELMNLLTDSGQIMERPRYSKPMIYYDLKWINLNKQEYENLKSEVPQLGPYKWTHPEVEGKLLVAYEGSHKHKISNNQTYGFSIKLKKLNSPSI